MGRIGLILGEADVNISSMTLARTASRQDALMLLAVDDEVSDKILEQIQEPSGGPRRLVDSRRPRTLTSLLGDAERPRTGEEPASGAARLIPAGLDAGSGTASATARRSSSWRNGSRAPWRRR